MMTPQFLATATFAMLGSLTVAAQTPTPSSRPQPPSTPMSGQTDQKADQKSITLTGCLKAWDASMEASRGAGSMGRDSGAMMPKFVLSNAKADQMRGGSTATMPGDDKAAATPSTQYGLAAGSGVDLSTHVNHQVRVTGMRHDTASPTSAPTAGVMPVSDVSGDSQQTRTGNDAAYPMVMVTSVTLVSNTCTK